MTVRLVFSAAALCAFTASAHADVLISTDPTQNMTCSGGVCSPTAADAVLNVNDLANMLATGDTKVTTGSDAVNIDVVAALGWSSTSRLTLDANTGLNVQAPVTVAGSGALTLTYNDGGSNGDLIFSNGGNATFANLSSSLIINGNSFTLVKDITTLAAAVKGNGSGRYALVQSYDATNDVFRTVPIAASFYGTFEGLGNKISNLTIKNSARCKIEKGDNTQCQGFFAHVKFGGLVRDLYLANTSLTASDTVAYAGTLAAISEGTIANVSVSGSVQGNASNVGGMIGSAGAFNPRYHNITAGVDVTSGRSGAIIGGLFGNGSTCAFMDHAYATGNVSGSGALYAGGLAGLDCEISDSYATGAVRGQQYAGGLVGAGSTIERSFATGSVSASAGFAGGFVGQSYDIEDCYSLGPVTGNGGVVAGFVGFGSGVSTSYSTGQVSSSGGLVGGFKGLTELRHEPFGLAYWDVDTSGTDNGCAKVKSKCKGVTGLTDVQLKSALPAGFDPNIWGQSPNINNGYPYLLANPPH